MGSSARTGSGIRTHTPFRTTDFESVASTVPPSRPAVVDDRRAPDGGRRRWPLSAGGVHGVGKGGPRNGGAVLEDFADRCRGRYTLRLTEAAREAKRQGCDAFTTTLLYSIYQKHDLLRELGDRIGAEEGMQDFTMSLKALVDAELIDRQTAFSVAPNVEALKMALKGIDVSQPGIL